MSANNSDADAPPAAPPALPRSKPGRKKKSKLSDADLAVKRLQKGYSQETPANCKVSRDEIPNIRSAKNPNKNTGRSLLRPFFLERIVDQDWDRLTSMASHIGSTKFDAFWTSPDHSWTDLKAMATLLGAAADMLIDGARVNAATTLGVDTAVELLKYVHRNKLDAIKKRSTDTTKVKVKKEKKAAKEKKTKAKEAKKEARKERKAVAEVAKVDTVSDASTSASASASAKPSASDSGSGSAIASSCKKTYRGEKTKVRKNDQTKELKRLQDIEKKFLLMQKETLAKKLAEKGRSTAISEDEDDADDNDDAESDKETQEKMPKEKVTKGKDEKGKTTKESGNTIADTPVVVATPGRGRKRKVTEANEEVLHGASEPDEPPPKRVRKNTKKVAEAAADAATKTANKAEATTKKVTRDQDNANHDDLVADLAAQKKNVKMPKVVAAKVSAPKKQPGKKGGKGGQ